MDKVLGRLTMLDAQIATDLDDNDANYKGMELLEYENEYP